jgi:transcriptional regulator with XRE-family HTH domain
MGRELALSARQIAQLSQRLTALRDEQGLTQRALEKKSGLSSGTISALERGRAQPTLATMLALEAALAAPSLEHLLGPVTTPLMPSQHLWSLRSKRSEKAPSRRRANST